MMFDQSTFQTDFLITEDTSHFLTNKIPNATNTMLNTIREYRMFDNIHRLGVGLSGGADSIALLECTIYLMKVGLIPDLEVIPIHINQYMNLQNVECLDKFVKSRYGLVLQVVTSDTRTIAN